MADALIVTPGAADANSYASLATARAYYDNTPGATEPELEDDDDLTRALLTATSLIDDRFEFDGIPTTYTQALAFPRYGLLTKSGAALDPHTIPAALANACAELARQLAKNTKLAEQQDTLLGVTKIKAGRAFEIDFAPGSNPGVAVIPDNVARMLARWGTRTGTTGATALVRG